jgi:hypothetical protein
MTTPKRLMLGAAVIAVLIVSGSATAATPQTSRFSFQDSYVDTQTCPGMSLDTGLDGHIVVQMISETRVQVHERLTYSVTANGKAFTDNESFTNFADLTTGVQTFAGTVVSIQVPGYGNVLADTGLVIFDPSTDPWTVYHVAGLHQFFYDGYGALCAYLAS